MNLPNRLTMLRVLLVPFFIGCFYLEFYVAALIIFLAACFTDFLDGYIARRYDMITDFGKLMDPIADKALTVSALILLVEARIAPSWCVIIIIIREFLVVAIRMAAKDDNKIIAASAFGKIKTVLQMAAITVMLASPGQLADVLLYLAVVATVLSGADIVFKHAKRR